MKVGDEGLADLLARVREAKGPDRYLDALIIQALTPNLHDAFADHVGFIVGGNHEQPTRAPELTASIDAALALVERLLQTYSLRITIDPSGNGADLTWWPDGLAGGRRIQAGGVSIEPPLAILAALLSALSSPTLNSEDK